MSNWSKIVRSLPFWRSQRPTSSAFDLGLRVGEMQDLPILGPLSVAIQNSSSEAEALECMSRFMFVHGRDLSVSVIDDPDGVCGVVAVRYGFRSGVRPPPQATDMTMVFVHRAMRFLAGQDYGLRSVDLPYRPVTARARYEDVFGAPARFDRPAAVLRVPKSLLSQRLDGVDETLRTLAMAFLSRQARHPGPTMAAKVRGVLGQSLGTGSAELRDVAAVWARGELCTDYFGTALTLPRASTDNASLHLPNDPRTHRPRWVPPG
jgi:hypothetical protein